MYLFLKHMKKPITWLNPIDFSQIINTCLFTLNAKFLNFSLSFKIKNADVSISNTPPPPCQQTSAFQIPLPPSKMLTYFMDGPVMYHYHPIIQAYIILAQFTFTIFLLMRLVAYKTVAFWKWKHDHFWTKGYKKLSTTSALFGP